MFTVRFLSCGAGCHNRQPSNRFLIVCAKVLTDFSKFFCSDSARATKKKMNENFIFYESRLLHSISSNLIFSGSRKLRLAASRSSSFPPTTSKSRVRFHELALECKRDLSVFQSQPSAGPPPSRSHPCVLYTPVPSPAQP